ncbi:manganese/iron transporter ATP-binding protein [Photobacterium kishitanii]|uniref:Manganese/iron ABC transporter ATP-binding protein n=1 Tax=Photobacterium kishitanii TaxID=318456 RepID=A0A2T3KF41_9GAMM|nr:manganese/iron ABC transporter ATP-binding protein [Photobacterium kishitanii]KJG10812.1 manganese/iron transporter ATP-binding protein [Photobacterium kishitanii]KJG59820.1 manganese/iron transporter ATP-binding protein [Photobacterium kishitanii]KJG63104.1 manganese/iron transporter ATP-binding protein [Photobacterium kishitanii]KJG67882.1 manganese/iron transporter ATP-binding protein [Photobacterium kishitanii]KJG71277.1 manganese/iron transporter ATP-binding protein [Photobacterium kis
MSGLTIDNVTVTYRNGHTALHNASFSIPQGSIAALVGINGSGKSTLFKSIMGFVPVSQGTVNIMGMAAKRALKQNIVAYVPQSEEIDWNFPVLVEDVVMMGRYGYMNMFRIPRAEDHQQVTSALERVNMVSYRKRQIGELSGGQRKRVFLARALAQESKVILLDEPFTGVDVQTEEQIMALLRALRDEGKVMLVSTHNLGSVPDFCDRTVLINKTILASGFTKDIFTPENLKIAFGGVLRHFILGGKDLHHDDDQRQVNVLSDHKRPIVMYGNS